MSHPYTLLWRVVGLAGLIVVLSAAASAAHAATPARPNIVLILADDLGYTDLGAYGSEIATPNIDALATSGVLFTNYHASPMCAPSRAMLMTGLDSHRTGMGNLPELLPPEHVGKPGYTGHLEDGVITIASRLKTMGYRTYMTGKWHLGHTAQTLPSARGFDRSFILDATGADNWEKKSYLPLYKDANWFEDDQPVDLPSEFYSSEFLVNRMIHYIDSPSDRDQPFFAYVAFQAMHIPVQAPREYTQKYIGTYTSGWNPLRASRRQGAIDKGLIKADTLIRPFHKEFQHWDDLGPDEQALMSKSMAVYAGMLEAMDYHVGRLVTHLKASGQYDNTIFIVTSDNGPEGSDPLRSSKSFGWWLRGVGYRRDLDTLGERGSYVYIGPEFASAAASPHDYFKSYASEGALRVPLIVAGPDVQGGRMARGFSFITDLPSTILDIATNGMANQHGGTEMMGRSLVPVLRGTTDSVHLPNEATGVETGGQSALFRGNLKLVRNAPPLGDNLWRLFDMANDPGETRDLAVTRPEDFASMMAAYQDYAARNGVQEMPVGYIAFDIMLARTTKALLLRNWWVVLGALGLLGLLMWALFRFVRRQL